ncbi:unnamed protein product [Bemisia tabaci]|uniref:Transposase n=1 Tax=Bemisia tabaci TaxID=7038 RepID=A0A9N9ZYJ6_BEMTA|nr:unnamed protein product [Bemisia tabaci]
MFSDEATFKSNGEVNRHNCHYWAADNPHWLQPVDNQNVWKLNVWCGIIGNYIIGPYFFDGTVTGEVYLDFIENQLPGLLENVPLNVQANMFFQQDGAPVHFKISVRTFLNQQYPGRWIGRGGPIAWPPRSPDLTCLDFYLWGKLKDAVYKSRPNNPEEMKQRIRDVCASITPQELSRVRKNFRKRLVKCIESNGNTFEHKKI